MTYTFVEIPDSMLIENKPLSVSWTLQGKYNQYAIAEGHDDAPRIAVDLNGKTAIGTDETNTGKFLHPDGLGGVEWRGGNNKIWLTASAAGSSATTDTIYSPVGIEGTEMFFTSSVGFRVVDEGSGVAFMYTPLLLVVQSTGIKLLYNYVGDYGVVPPASFLSLNDDTWRIMLSAPGSSMQIKSKWEGNVAYIQIRCQTSAGAGAKKSELSVYGHQLK